MSERSYGKNSIADRRYYHFVVVKGRNVSLAAYWKRLNDIGDVGRPNVVVPLGATRFTLEHRKLSSQRAYARGATAQDLSENGKGRPPFFYDLFAARNDRDWIIPDTESVVSMGKCRFSTIGESS